MTMRYSTRQPSGLIVLFIAGLQLAVFNSNGQRYPNIPLPELAWSLKAVTRSIQYDKNSLYRTDPGSIGLQTGARYDAPVKTGNNRYIDLVGQAGFLFCKARVFDTTFFDAVTNRYTRQHSHNPSYMPVSLGIYNMSPVSIGTELFYWKGLGTRDIWGIQFLSLGFNAKQFRLTAAGQWYAQVKEGKNNGLLFSVDFCWKLISSWYKVK